MATTPGLRKKDHFNAERRREGEEREREREGEREGERERERERCASVKSMCEDEQT